MNFSDNGKTTSEDFFSGRDSFSFHEPTRNKRSEMDAYKNAHALVQLRTLARRLQYRGNIYALNAKELAEEIENREHEISDALSLGTYIRDDDGDIYIVTSVKYIKDDEGAGTVGLKNTKTQDSIRIPLYDLLSRTWSIERRDVVLDFNQISLENTGEYIAYFRQTLAHLLSDTTVDMNVIRKKTRHLAKTATEKKNPVTPGYLEEIALRAANDLRDRDKKI